MRPTQTILGASIALLAAAMALAQPVQNVTVQPECQVFLSTDGTGLPVNSVSWDNRTRACDRWIATYTTYGFPGALSLAVQSSADNAGAPAAWVNFAGVIVSGINPNTAITQGLTSLSGYYPWMKLTLTATGVGAGRLTATLYGYKDRPATAIIAGIVATNLAQYGGAAVGAGNALHVQPGTGALFNLGTVVAGADTVANNAQVNPATGAGGLAVFQYYYNGGTWDRAHGTAAGGVWVQGPAATGSAPAGNPNRIGGLGSGATGGLLAESTVCDLSAPITLAAAAGSTQVVALVAARSIRVCHVSLSMQAPVGIKLVRGTGANCVAGPADITGVYSTVLALSMDFANGPVIVTAANALCINLDAAVAGGGIVTYAVY